MKNIWLISNSRQLLREECLWVPIFVAAFFINPIFPQLVPQQPSIFTSILLNQTHKSPLCLYFMTTQASTQLFTSNYFITFTTSLSPEHNLNITFIDILNFQQHMKIYTVLITPENNIFNLKMKDFVSLLGQNKHYEVDREKLQLRMKFILSAGNYVKKLVVEMEIEERLVTEHERIVWENRLLRGQIRDLQRKLGEGPEGQKKGEIKEQGKERGKESRENREGKGSREKKNDKKKTKNGDHMSVQKAISINSEQRQSKSEENFEQDGHSHSEDSADSQSNKTQFHQDSQQLSQDDKSQSQQSQQAHNKKNKRIRKTTRNVYKPKMKTTRAGPKKSTQTSEQKQKPKQVARIISTSPKKPPSQPIPSPRRIPARKSAPLILREI